MTCLQVSCTLDNRLKAEGIDLHFHFYMWVAIDLGSSRSRRHFSVVASPLGFLHYIMENVRNEEEIKKALKLLYDTDLNQLAGVIASGPSAGRSKLLWAVTLSTDREMRAVREPAGGTASSSPSDAAPAKETITSGGGSSGDTSQPASKPSSDPPNIRPVAPMSPSVPHP